MNQTNLESRVHIVLERIKRTEAILAANLNELTALVPAMIETVRGGRLNNLLGSPAQVQIVARSPIVDLNAMTITWGGRTCRVRQVVLLRLFDRLSRRLDHYVPIDRLLRDVWDGHVRTDDTVRSTVRHLKRRLAAAEMSDLAAAIKASGRRYGLMLDHFE